MGLIALAQRRGHIWRWRLRYWYLDTPAGRTAQLGGFAVAILVAIVNVVLMLLAASAPPRVEPAQAIADWIIYLILLIISALISYAMRPKPENAKPQQVQSPNTQDGTPAKDVFGTVWIDHDESFLLAWKIVGRDPIKTKSGK